MKTLKYLFGLSLVFLFCVNCTEREDDLGFVNSIKAPTNVSALFQITQDNTGTVTVTPNSEGGVSYNVTFGDGGAPVVVKQGANAQHVYTEGTYKVTVEAISLSGLKSEYSKDIVVSFKAPQNLVATAENDAALTKQVNVTANAEFAMFYEVYFGEPGYDEPVVGNIGEVVSYTYQTVGVYNIRVVAKGGATVTTETIIEDFEVTAILQPLEAAKKPPFRQPTDVISIYSDAYTSSVPDVNFFPNWGQATTYAEITVAGNKMIQYGNLNYEGIDFGTAVDASGMKFLHIDVWTADLTSFDIWPISTLTGEKKVTKALTKDQWVSFDIPLEDFISQGLSMADIFQFKLESATSGTIFVDNIYFWKEAVGYVPLIFDNFEGDGNITTWVGDGGTGLNIALPNPHVNAGNFSKTVLEYDDAGIQYANVQFVADGNFDLSGGKSVFTLKLYVPSSSITGAQTNQISLKLQNNDLGGNSWQTQTEIVKPIILDAWQVLTFDFGSDPFINLDPNSLDPVLRTDLNKVVIQLNSENNTDKVKGYIDDFKYGTTPNLDAAPFARDGFEGFGTISTWDGDNADINTAFANPYINASNNSATVLQYVDNGGQYANAAFVVTPKFNLIAKNKFTLQIYVPSASITGTQPNQISLKLQNTGLGGNSWQTQTEIVKPIVLDTWQEITFDFVNDTFANLDPNSPDPRDRTDLDKVVIQINGENNTDKVIAYIDNFNYHN